MQILILSKLYPPNVVGGYERLRFEITSALAEAGHEMTVLTSTFGTVRADYPKQTVPASPHYNNAARPPARHAPGAAR